MIADLLTLVDPSHLVSADPGVLETADASDLLAKRRGGGIGGGSYKAPILLIVLAVIVGLVIRFRQPIMAALGPAFRNAGRGMQSPPAAAPGDVAMARNPQTPPQTLTHMVHNAPALRPHVAANPATDPGLLKHLSTLGDPEVNKALTQRGFGVAPAPQNQYAQNQYGQQPQGPGPFGQQPQAPGSFGPPSHPQQPRPPQPGPRPQLPQQQYPQSPGPQQFAPGPQSPAGPNMNKQQVPPGGRPPWA
ncbi:MAG: hypothetical protein QM658_04475 [Gordonia sp. (in: high G+C Gram-positive bacteria)]